MIQASYFIVFTFFIIGLGFFGNVFAAPSFENHYAIENANVIQKREGNILHAFGLGLLAVKDGIFGTLDGMKNPSKGSGSREAIEKSATTAGNNVGSGLGSALKGGGL